MAFQETIYGSAQKEHHRSSYLINGYNKMFYFVSCKLCTALATYFDVQLFYHYFNHFNCVFNTI